MQNIIKFIAKSTIKPELAHVYVHKVKDRTYAVATDAFKLARLDLTDHFICEYLSDGFYTKEQWQAITKELNKKNANIENIISIFDLVKLYNDPKGNYFKYKDFNYPDYTQIIPDGKDLLPLQIQDARYTRDVFIEFIELLPDQLNLTDLWTNSTGKFTVYENKQKDLLILIAHRNN